MKIKHALVIGGAIYDVTFFSPAGIILPPSNSWQKNLLAFELGAKFYLDHAYFTSGGGGANAATTFAKLGLKTALISTLGKDYHGQWLIDNLKKNNIGLNFLQSSPKPTGLSFIISAGLGQEHVLFTYRGANEDLKIDADVLIKNYQAHKFDLLYLSSLSGRLAKSNLAHIFNLKRKFSALTIAWNPGSPQIKMGLNELKPYLKQTDILIINKDEAAELCQKNLSAVQLKNIHNLLEVLSRSGPLITVISAGALGAHALYQQKKYFVPALKIKARDTTGVGDTFGATFAWAINYTNYDLEKSLFLAIKNATANLKEIGAETGLLTKKQLLSK